MLGQTVFFASGPVEVSGNTLSTNTGNLGTPSNKYSNLYLTGTGFADEFSARKTSLVTGEITGLSVSNLYPVGQPDLGHPNQRWRNLYITGTGYMDKLFVRELDVITGDIDALSITNLYPLSSPDLGHNSLRWKNTYTTGTGYFDRLITRDISAQTGQITGLSVGNLYPVGQPNLGHSFQQWANAYITGTAYINRIESVSQFTQSGVFDYLGPTGRFFPPLLTYEQRTGLFSGYSTTGITPYDGLLVYQTTSGQKLMTVQSGMWKTVNLS